MEILHVAASALAAWRIAHMLAWEAGPFWIFVRLRSFLGVGHDGSESTQWNSKQEIFMCNLCSTVWFTALFYFLWYISPIPVLLISAMGLAALFVKVSTWLDQQRS